MREQVVDQVLTVELEPGADAVLVVEQRRLDRVARVVVFLPARRSYSRELKIWTSTPSSALNNPLEIPSNPKE
jgi:hypothetical protein